jgi:hypothetical protein
MTTAHTLKAGSASALSNRRFNTRHDRCTLISRVQIGIHVLKAASTELEQCSGDLIETVMAEPG